MRARERRAGVSKLANAFTIAVSIGRLERWVVVEGSAEMVVGSGAVVRRDREEFAAWMRGSVKRRRNVRAGSWRSWGVCKAGRARGKG